MFALFLTTLFLLTSDPYLWLENCHSHETKEWLRKEKQLTENYFIESVEHEKVKELITTIFACETKQFPTITKKSHNFFLRRDPTKEQSSLYRLDAEGTPVLVVDPLRFAEEGTAAIAAYQIDTEEKILAFGLIISGSDQFEWHFLDLITGEDLPDILKNAWKVCWDPRGAGVYYLSRATHETEFGKLYFHRIGSLQSQDTKMFEEHSFDMIDVVDKQYLGLHAWKPLVNHFSLFYADLKECPLQLTELVPYSENNYTYIGIENNQLFFITDDEAPKRRIISIDPLHPERDHWQELVKESDSVINQAALTKDHLVVCYLEDAYHKITLFDRKRGDIQTIELPGYGTTKLCCYPLQSQFYFSYSDFIHPGNVYVCDPETGSYTLNFSPQVPWDAESYETKQIFYKSKDGTKIPLFIVRKKGIPLNGEGATLLSGYGGFNTSISPLYDVKIMSWLELGGTYALANIRGGGEYGEEWHYGGNQQNKQNAFDDFMAAAEWLIANRYTNPKKLAIYGRSNGGLLTAACLTQRPDLFQAAVVQAGVLDMLRFHLFGGGWLWMYEYGSPERKEDYQNLLTYSPYHNVVMGEKYPSTLVITGDHDDRVHPLHSYKFTAALQEASRGENPILLRIYPHCGHGMGASRRQQIEEATDFLTFLLQELKTK